MEKRLFVIVIAFFLTAGVAAAREKTPEPTINDVLAKIRSEQQVTSNDRINPDKISDKLLEQLGDVDCGVRSCIRRAAGGERHILWHHFFDISYLLSDS